MEVYVFLLCIVALGVSQVSSASLKVPEVLSHVQKLADGLNEEKLKSLFKRSLPNSADDHIHSHAPQLLTRLKRFAHQENEGSMNQIEQEGEDVLQQILSNGQSSDSDEVSQGETQQQYEVHGVDPEGLAKIDIETVDCSKELRQKCLFMFIELAGAYQDLPRFCEKLTEVSTCVSTIAETCSDADKEELKEILDEIDGTNNELCVTATESSTELDLEEAYKCLEDADIKDMVTSCAPYAERELIQEIHRIHSTSDAVCLAYIHIVTCASNKVSEKCGKVIGEAAYEVFIRDASKLEETKDSQYCQFDISEEQEPSPSDGLETEFAKDPSENEIERFEEGAAKFMHMNSGSEKL